MELEEDDFTQLFVEAVREFGRATTRREAAQQAAECVAERVGRFNGDKVPFYMEAYNEEMDVRGVNDALRLNFFCRIVAPRIYTEVKELGEAHSLWEVFEDALWRAYNKPSKSRNRRDFDPWVASAKTHRGATKAFQEFGQCLLPGQGKRKSRKCLIRKFGFRIEVRSERIDELAFMTDKYYFRI